MELTLTKPEDKVPCPECELPFTPDSLMTHLAQAHPEIRYRLCIVVEPVEEMDAWDKEMLEDQERLGPDEFVRRLSANMKEASEYRKAALRLLNNLVFKSEEHREAVLQDIQILLGEAL